MIRRRVRQKVCGSVLGILAASLVGPAPVLANGVIVCPHPHPHPQPEPPGWRRPRPIRAWTPFEIASQRVDVAIHDLSAKTTVEQVFVNRSHRPTEGTYLFPVPQNAAVHDFALWMNGREVSAELLDADKARRIYESIVSKMRDPALLQFAGCGLIQAKVFPIPPGGRCRIKLTYDELLRSDAGLVGYRFLLDGAGGQGPAIRQFSLRAVIRTAVPLANIFSPSHACRIDRPGEREAIVSFETSHLTNDGDFQLQFATDTDPIGFSLLAHRRFGEDGFFMARIAPHFGSRSDAPMPKNICFVLDTSGSMADDNKIAQAKRALKFCVTNLGREDRFSLITFATEVRPFRADWSRTDEETLDAARGFIDGLGAVGGTDINAAVLRALSMNPAKSRIDLGNDAGREAWRKNPYFIVFVTDGEPTVGVTDPAQILENVARGNATAEARVFALGVGYHVNTKLLDRLADDNGGARNYVTPNEDLELKMSAFYSKLAKPVLGDLSLAFEGVTVHDVYPRTLPDLFQGSELVILGRYEAPVGAGHTMRMTGTARGDLKTFTYDCRFPVDAPGNDFLPRVWAVRKIGTLLDALRLHGESRELKEEVVRLSTRYGILTPYTSFLVQEDEKIALREGRAPAAAAPAKRALGGVFRRNAGDMEEAANGQADTTGRRTVIASKRNLAMRKMRAPSRVSEQVAAFARDAEGRQMVNLIGAKAFYRDNGRWVDADYDGKAKTSALAVFGDAYYTFITANPAVGKFLAQGDRVVLCWNGQVYETAPHGGPTAPPP